MIPIEDLTDENNDDSVKKMSQCMLLIITITHTGQDRGWTWADIAEVLLKRRRG